MVIVNVKTWCIQSNRLVDYLTVFYHFNIQYDNPDSVVANGINDHLYYQEVNADYEVNNNHEVENEENSNEINEEILDE
jgi:hypothetical protein